MYGVILAGGSGTRFWPLSREEYPKQLLKIFGNQTLIQVTLSRISSLIQTESCYVVTNPQQIEQIRLQLKELGGSALNYISEPERRNTAGAIGLAAINLRKADPEAVMVVLSADHFIRDEAAFHESLLKACRIAESGRLVTLGAKPTRPETAYGYIQCGAPLQACDDAHAVKRFIEKPEREQAEKYLADEKTLWNTGIFVWRADVILKEIEKYMPELHKGLQEVEAKIGTNSEDEALRQIYAGLPSVSIDYGVLERSEHLAVVQTDMGWEDVGSWNALDEVVPGDADGNIISGNVINIGCQNSTVYAEKRVVGVVGLENIVVADTEDATLVCSKDHAQDVKKVVENLKKQNGVAHLVHRTVYRHWGSYTVLEEGEGYKVKKLMVHPRSRLSLQMHHQRSEHWVVVEGEATVTVGESVYKIPVNQSTFVPMGVKHRLENATDVPLRLVEVQNGHYLGEDDIVRFEDDYDRLPKKVS